MKTTIHTPVGELRYTNIKGEGRNVEVDKSKEPRMQYSTLVLIKKGSKEAKQFEAELKAAWEEYQKEERSALGTWVNKCAQYKPFTAADPDGTIDPETGKVRRVDTEYMAISPYTQTTWTDGKPKEVKLYITNPEGATEDKTAAYQAASWSVGNGSKGLAYCTLIGNTSGNGKAKLTLYLNGVHLAKLEKYTGSDIEVVEVVAEDGGVDLNAFDDVAPTETTEDERPEL